MRDAALKEHFASLERRKSKPARGHTRRKKGNVVMSEEVERHYGVVKWFKAGRGSKSPGSGYGFIQGDTPGPDIFVHISQVERSGLTELREGDRVSYRLATDPKRRRTNAVDLELEHVN
jgi:cold shock protein